MKRNSRSAEPLRFAVVGLGHIAQAAVLPAFRHARPHAELSALVSGTPAKLKKLGKRYRVDVLLMTGYRLHFERCNLEVADIVRRKRIGEARYFDSQFSMQVKADNIRTDRELGGGPEWDIGIYCQNAARYVFQDEPTRVWATTTNSGDARFKEIPETVHVILEFPGERIANFICSFGAADRSRYEIVGTKGSIVVDPAYEYAEGLGYELTLGEKKRRKKFSKSDQFAPELVYFARCVREKRAPEPSGKEGLIDVAIIEAIHESVATGQWVELDSPTRTQRPTLRQEIRRPPVPREPPLVQAESGHS
jgi:predicted dehydrogenase